MEGININLVFTQMVMETRKKIFPTPLMIWGFNFWIWWFRGTS